MTSVPAIFVVFLILFLARGPEGYTADSILMAVTLIGGFLILLPVLEAFFS